MIGARPSASADPSASAAPSPTASATAPATSPAPTNSAQPSATASGSLDGRQFVSVLVTENGKSKVLVPGTKVRLGFSDGMISVSAGCNSMSGDYSVADGKLVVGSMATTDMGCQANLMGQDQWLATFLGKKPTVSVDGNNLVLTSETTEVTFLDREQAEPDQPLTGITWGLTTILNGDTASSVPAGVSPTLLFDDQGGFTYNDGCNAGGGQYAINGSTITFSQIVSTQMACGGVKDEAAGAIRAVINDGSATYSIDHSTLSLHAGDHGLQYDAAVDLTN
jgi:heat shock protein HslJ